jgi:quinol monooxygenase YgiN
MISKGLLVRLEHANASDEAALEAFLKSAQPLAQQEAATRAWFALRFGRGAYGIIDFFADDAGRQAQLNGAIAEALQRRQQALAQQPPALRQLDVLAHKLPDEDGLRAYKGLLLSFKAKSGHEQQVAQFLRDALPFVEREPGTVAWFALRFDAEHFGIFDVFPDNAARFAHLTGHVPRELAKHALSLLGGMPDLDLVDVVETMIRAEPMGVTGV